MSWGRSRRVSKSEVCDQKIDSAISTVNAVLASEGVSSLLVLRRENLDQTQSEELGREDALQTLLRVLLFRAAQREIRRAT